jgi:uncharacterized membrane protein YfcA
MRSLFRPAKAGLITVRAAIILAIACIIGAAAGALTYLASHSFPQALLAAGTATGGSTGLLNQIIGTAPERPNSDQNNQDDDKDHGVGQRVA